MSNFKKLALAILAASFCASTPVIAADTATAPAATQAKPDMGAALKDKAGAAIEQGKQKVDTAAQNLEKSLGVNKNATQPKTETLDVTQETVTVETPQGAAQETTITVTPEGAQPATPPAK